MKKATKYALALGFVLLLGACSSKKSSSSSADDLSAPPTDATAASTDTLPQDNPESLQAAASPPADPAAPAAPDAPPTPAADALPGAQADNATLPSDPAPGTPPAAPLADASSPSAATPSSDASSSGGGGSYTVQAGDTLMKIAFDNYGDLYRWKAIYEANKEKIKDPNHVPPGVVLTLDPSVSRVTVDKNGEKYLIKSGDTLGTISNQVYGTKTKWKKIWENNKQLIHDPNKIFAGFYLYYVPEAGGQPQEVTPAPISDSTTPPAAPDASANRSSASVPPPPSK